MEREDEALKQSEKVISKYSEKFRCSADEEDDEDEEEDEVNQFSINLHLREDETFSTFFPHGSSNCLRHICSSNLIAFVVDARAV